MYVNLERVMVQPAVAGKTMGQTILCLHPSFGRLLPKRPPAMQQNSTSPWTASSHIHLTVKQMVRDNSSPLNISQQQGKLVWPILIRRTTSRTLGIREALCHLFLIHLHSSLTATATSQSDLHVAKAEDKKSFQKNLKGFCSQPGRVQKVLTPERSKTLRHADNSEYLSLDKAKGVGGIRRYEEASLPEQGNQGQKHIPKSYAIGRDAGNVERPVLKDAANVEPFHGDVKASNSQQSGQQQFYD